jgi:hypothetical protein
VAARRPLRDEELSVLPDQTRRHMKVGIRHYSHRT